VICIPLSSFLERRFRNRGSSAHIGSQSLLLSGFVRGLILIFVIIGFTIAVGRILSGPDTDSATLWLLHFLYLGSIPLLLGVFTYWVLLAVVRRVLLHSEESVVRNHKCG